MNTFDSPMEALAVNYLNVGFVTVVNNLWTWVAVITAAVSFWRIRAAGGSTAVVTCPKSEDSPNPLPNDQSSSRPEPVPQISVPDVSAVEPPPPTTSPAPAPLSAAELMEIEEVKFDGVTKGTKFVAVYYGDRQDSDAEWMAANEWEESGGDVEAEVSGYGEWWENWEKGLRMRTGETGWYRCQDLTRLNGNVVRLWDYELN